MPVTDLEALLSSTDTDPFDPAALRLPPAYDAIAVKKVLATVPVRKPGKHDFVRVRPEPEFRETVGLIQIGDDREFYAVSPVLVAELAGEYAIYMLYTTINRQGTLVLWPVRMPESDGKQNEWSRSAHEAAALAVEKWVRVTANRNLGAYEICHAQGELSEPIWPEYTFRDLLHKAFKERLINRIDHPVIKQLRGLV
jgi:hypothetical protein